MPLPVALARRDARGRGLSALRQIPREAVLGGALVVCALFVLLVPPVAAVGAAAVGVAAERAGYTRLAAIALGVCLLGLLLVALVWL